MRSMQSTYFYNSQIEVIQMDKRNERMTLAQQVYLDRKFSQSTFFIGWSKLGNFELFGEEFSVF